MLPRLPYSNQYNIDRKRRVEETAQEWSICFGDEAHDCKEEREASHQSMMRISFDFASRFI